MAKQQTDAASTVDTGQAAPAFTLNDQDGKAHALKDYHGKWVVLYFYPKDDTPGCTVEACQFRDGRADFSNAEAVVLGVSPDDVASHRKFADKFDLPFTLLADPDREVCEKYGVWREKNNYGKKSMGVVRSTYLIDPQGKVAQRWDKVKVEGHDRQVLEAIAEATG